MSISVSEIADQLSHGATVLELCGENAFKVRAHQHAARIVETWGGSVQSLLEQTQSGKVRGIGAALASRIALLAESLPDPELDALAATLPPGLFEMMRVPGLGPKKVRALWKELSIETLDSLAAACSRGEVAGLKGFGKKTEQNIIQGIERLKQYASRFLLSDASPCGERICDWIGAHAAVAEATVAGSCRRARETVGDLDIVVSTEAPSEVLARVCEFPDRKEIIGHGDTKVSMLLQSGMQVDVRAVRPSEYIAALSYFTGNKEHNTQLRARARGLDLTLNEYGLWKGDSAVPLESEEDLYAALNLAYITPELREDRGEIALAEAAFRARKRLPALVEPEDLKGLMHLHTTYSDGRHSVEEMARAAIEAGYEYMVVTDHSQSAAYAHGLNADAVRRQHREIDELNRSLAPFRIFKGIESDILADGSLDYPDKVLESFEVIIASVHSQFTMSEKDMTARIIQAARNPYTTCLGHLTGRLLLEREGYALNIEEILKVCGEEGVAIEINANPHRLDLDWRYHALALSHHVELPICPDAHSAEAIGDAHWGVSIARKGGLMSKNIPNCLGREEFERWAKRRRKE
jgi:DNA polymerase (family 10)